MITVRERYLLLLKLVGLDPFGGLKNIIGRIIISVVLVLFALMVSTFLALGFRQNIDEVLPTLPMLLVLLAILIYYFHMLLHREQIHFLLAELEDIVHESLYLL